MSITPDMLWAWRVVHADFTSRRNYRWPFPGHWAQSDWAVDTSNAEACPNRTGDGLCLAKTWAGAASGGIVARSVLVCGYYAADVLGENNDKLRVRRAYVWDLWNAEALVVKYGSRANLDGASLVLANLKGANLDGASLVRTNLDGANLDCANLAGAILDLANFDGVTHCACTRWPSGYEPANAIKRKCSREI